VIVSEAPFDELRRLIRRRLGLNLTDDRRLGTEQAIVRAMKRSGIVDFKRYCDVVRSDQRVWDDLIDELTVGETYFFRDAAQFRFIRETILPEIRERRGDGTARVWSAGCASGEEAYSLAIVLNEAGFDRASVIATDVSRASLLKAERGVYGDWSMRGDAASAARSGVDRKNDDYVVKPTIKKMVHFHTLNLVLDDYPEPSIGIDDLDLILCRNVFIYMDEESVARIARKLYESLAPGGRLVTGASDPPPSAAPFEVETTDQGVFYRRGDPTKTRSYVVTGAIDPAAIEVSPRSLATAIADVPLESDQADTCDNSENTFISENRQDEFTSQNRQEAILSNHLHDEASTKNRRIKVLPDNRQDSSSTEKSDEAVLAEARYDWKCGNYALAAERTRELAETNIDAAILHVRAIANADAEEAARVCSAATKRHPLASELHLLEATLALELDRLDAAIDATRRAIFLDGGRPGAHFTLGSILMRRGDREGALRAFRNTIEACGSSSPAAGSFDPLVESDSPERYAALARDQIARIQELSDHSYE
jgi:chemotaxis protein methyltransferase CheR